MGDSCVNCGWNGTTADSKFIDNSSNINAVNNGSNFTIVTDDSSNFFVFDLYLFCATSSISNHTGTVTFEGKRNGMSIFSFTKSSAFVNPVTLTPNNGFTYIDFATEGASDFTSSPIDELVFTSTGNLDYMALDAFQWTSTMTPVTLTNFSVE